MVKHISYSALKDWYTCPYYFKLTKIDKIYEFTGNAFTAFGSALHGIIDDQIKHGNITKQFDDFFLEELKKIPKEEVFNSKQLIKDMRKQGKMIIPQVFPSIEKYFGDNTEIVSSEFPLYEKINCFSTSLSFKGFIDIILKTEDGKYHIADFKTCGWGWDGRHKGDKVVNYQLTLYKKFYSQKQNIDLADIETHFILLKRTASKNNVEPFRVTSGEKKIKNATDFMKLATVNIEKGNFIKKKSNCEKCILRKEKLCVF